MNITKEMIEQQASKTELYEDGYKGFVSGAEWVLSLIEANETNTVLAVSGQDIKNLIFAIGYALDAIDVRATDPRRFEAKEKAAKILEELVSRWSASGAVFNPSFSG